MLVSMNRIREEYVVNQRTKLSAVSFMAFLVAGHAFAVEEQRPNKVL
jgi:hypothetical protein